MGAIPMMSCASPSTQTAPLLSLVRLAPSPPSSLGTPSLVRRRTASRSPRVLVVSTLLPSTPLARSAPSISTTSIRSTASMPLALLSSRRRVTPTRFTTSLGMPSQAAPVSLPPVPSTCTSGMLPPPTETRRRVSSTETSRLPSPASLLMTTVPSMVVVPTAEAPRSTSGVAMMVAPAREPWMVTTARASSALLDSSAATSSPMADGSKKDVMKSHSDGEVWGLDQQADGTVVTSGDDNKVMFWDPATRTHQKTCKVSDRTKTVRRGASTLSDYPAAQQSRAVAVNGDWIAVSSNDGPVSIRAASDPSTEAHLLSDPKEWNEVMAFSPCNAYLAVGSHDNFIYVYSTADWSLTGKCRGHSSYIMALDWCKESKYIRSNCGAYELLFFTVPDCAQDPSGRSNTKGTAW